MNISEMTTATFADFVNASGDHIANIMQNERVAALFSDTENKSPIRFMADAASVLMGDCRKDPTGWMHTATIRPISAA